MWDTILQEIADGFWLVPCYVLLVLIGLAVFVVVVRLAPSITRIVLAFIKFAVVHIVKFFAEVCGHSKREIRRKMKKTAAIVDGVSAAKDLSNTPKK